MRNHLSAFLIIIISVSILHCWSKNEKISDKNTSSDITVTKLAIQKYGDDHLLSYNRNKTFAVIIKTDRDHKRIEKGVYSFMQFFVYDIKGKRAVFEETTNRGEVLWISDNQLEVKLIPGIVKGDGRIQEQIQGYIYDVLLKKKLPRNSKSMDQTQ